MNTMSSNEWIVTATFVVAFVLLAVALIRMIRGDGYGARADSDLPADWGTPTTPSRPYSSRL